MSPILLKIEGLNAGYSSVDVLRDVSLEVPEGEIVALIGPNGAGKTTLIRSISRLIRTRGDILFENQDISLMPPHTVVQSGIVQCADDRKLFPYMSVYANLMMGAYLRRDKADIMRDLDRVYSLFPILQERKNQQAGTLSGGEQQMASIGRALMAQPRLLLLDEPSFGIAPIVVDRIFDVITQLNNDGLSVLLVEQNVKLALEISNWTYVLENGCVVLDGPSEEIAGNEMIHKTYLGL